MDGHLDRPLAHAALLGQVAVGARLFIRAQEGFEGVEQLGLADPRHLVAQAGQRPVEHRQGPALLVEPFRRPIVGRLPAVAILARLEVQ